jgi:serine/threonine-protein kinase
MTTSRPALGFPVVAALLALTLDAHADDAANKAAAQALYDQAVKLMATNKLAEACKKLEDSSKLFDGLGTKGRLAECYEKSQRLASAWVLYRGALSLAESRADPRAAELRTRVASIEPRLSRLKVEVPRAARVSGLKIARDGTDLPEALWGVSLPVDGGVHSVEAAAPTGGWKGEIKIKNEGDDAVIVVTLPEQPLPSASASTGAPLAPAQDPPTPAEASARQTAGLILGGAGLVGLVVGATSA